jgi:putative copper resistance protein D
MSTMFLGMMFVFARGILYADVYGRGMREGIAPHADQRTAGGLMMTLDIVMMVVAVSWFFWLASREHDASGAYRLERPRRNTDSPGTTSEPQPPPSRILRASRRPAPAPLSDGQRACMPASRCPGSVQ